MMNDRAHYRRRSASATCTTINEEALPGTEIDEAEFWHAVNEILRDLAPKNRELLARQDDLQSGSILGTVIAGVRAMWL